MHATPHARLIPHPPKQLGRHALHRQLAPVDRSIQQQLGLQGGAGAGAGAAAAADDDAARGSLPVAGSDVLEQGGPMYAVRHDVGKRQRQDAAAVSQAGEAHAQQRLAPAVSSNAGGASAAECRCALRSTCKQPAAHTEPVAPPARFTPLHPPLEGGRVDVGRDRRLAAQRVPPPLPGGRGAGCGEAAAGAALGH